MSGAENIREKETRLSKEFKSEPTIQNYLRLRSLYPDVDIEIATSGSIEFAFKCQDLIEELGITIKDFLGLLDVDRGAVSRVCLHLLSDMVRAKEAAKAGETHLARRGKRIPEHAIDWLICLMLDSESWNGTLNLNRDLTVLIKSRLQASSCQFEQALDVRTHKTHAAMLGGQMKAKGITPSFRKVAALMKVQPSTVKRWFLSETDFHDACEPYSHWFDEDGAFKGLQQISRAQRPTHET